MGGWFVGMQTALDKQHRFSCVAWTLPASSTCAPPSLPSNSLPETQYYGEQGQLDNTPVPAALEKDKDPRLAASPLRFPGTLGGCLALARPLLLACLKPCSAARPAPSHTTALTHVLRINRLPW